MKASKLLTFNHILMIFNQKHIVIHSEMLDAQTCENEIYLAILNYYKIHAIKHFEFWKYLTLVLMNALIL